jgi:hypothetical protein
MTSEHGKLTFLRFFWVAGVQTQLETSRYFLTPIKHSLVQRYQTMKSASDLKW